MENRKAILKIELEPKAGQSTVEIAGNSIELLFALTALASNVCVNIGISTDKLVKMMPSMFSGYKKSLLDAESVSFKLFDGGKE